MTTNVAVELALLVATELAALVRTRQVTAVERMTSPGAGAQM